MMGIRLRNEIAQRKLGDFLAEWVGPHFHGGKIPLSRRRLKIKFLIVHP
jgi:hypothetical protein